MDEKKMLRKIYYENRAMNRNIQRLINIGFLGIFAGIAKDAKEKDDKQEKTMVKVGLALIAILEGMTMVSSIIDYRRAKSEEELDK